MTIEAAAQGTHVDELVRIEADISPRIQIALQQMGRPMLHELRLLNEGAERLENLRLRIKVDPAVAEEKILRIESLSRGQIYVLAAERLAIDWSAERLVNQTEREKGRLRIRRAAPRRSF